MSKVKSQVPTVEKGIYVFSDIPKSSYILYVREANTNEYKKYSYLLARTTNKIDNKGTGKTDIYIAKHYFVLNANKKFDVYDYDDHSRNFHWTQGEIITDSWAGEHVYYGIIPQTNKFYEKNKDLLQMGYESEEIKFTGGNGELSVMRFDDKPYDWYAPQEDEIPKNPSNPIVEPRKLVGDKYFFIRKFNAQYAEQISYFRFLDWDNKKKQLIFKNGSEWVLYDENGIDYVKSNNFQFINWNNEKINSSLILADKDTKDLNKVLDNIKIEYYFKPGLPSTPPKYLKTQFEIQCYDWDNKKITVSFYHRIISLPDEARSDKIQINFNSNESLTLPSQIINLETTADKYLSLFRLTALGSTVFTFGYISLDMLKMLWDKIKKK